MPDDDPDTEEEPSPDGPLDVPTLQTLAHRATTHPLVNDWAFDPSSASPRLLQITLDASAYPAAVTAARIDIRWFVSDDYSVHYLEEHQPNADRYQCRWDRHPKSTAPRSHRHPPPDAGDAEPSALEPHHLAVLFAVLDWVSDRVEHLYAVR